jgi:hypothetical protein
MEKKDEKTPILEKKSTKKWKIVIDNKGNYYEVGDDKLTDLDVAKLFIQIHSKNK